MPVHPYSHYKLATLLDEEEDENKKKRYHLILSSAAFIPLLRRKRAFASSLLTLPGLLEVLIPSLVVATFGILSLVIFFSPGNTTSAPMPSIIPASAATVSIVPMSITQQQSYTITAVTGNPNEAANQVYARTINTTIAPVSETVNATGQVPGTSATGTVYVESHDSNTLTINAGQRFTNLNTSPAIDIQFDMTVTVQPFQAQPGVRVHVVQAGTIGNIFPYSSSQPSFQNYCDPNVSNCGQGYDMFSDSTFTGGTDPQTVVQQSDIDNATTAFISAHTPDARQALQGQVQANEQLIVTQPCKAQSYADHLAGDQVSQFTVTVYFTCSGEVYNQDGALKLARSLLQQQVQQLHPTYELVGTIKPTLQAAALTDPNSDIVTMTIQASGTWVAHFDTQSEQALAQSIAGKTKAEAQTFLNNQPGIQMASIQLQGGTSDRLPTDPAKIIFTVLPT
jgi:hypothetical protein